jgi:3-deoxy-manno-octulosonate cytidylyltransferase (CMP-KDO synthetase)
MKHMAVIPARLESTRLYQKPLQLINGIPLIKYVAQKVYDLGLFDSVLVATDSEKIEDLFSSGPIRAVMTSVDHESGTDRIFEAVTTYESTLSDDKKCESVFNIQGDEPFIYGNDLENLRGAIENGAQMASLYEDLKPEALKNPNQVKVLLNNNSEAIYFSRFGAPFSREEGNFDNRYVGKHVGVYAYTKSFLESFCKAELGYHERFEKLEQLRALQMGVAIKMILTQNTYQGVDTKEDLEKVNKILNGKEVI